LIDSNSEDENEKTQCKNKIGGHEVIELKTNEIPKRLVPLETLFDHNYMAIKPSLQPQYWEIEDYYKGI
jgi:hypothetical protein